MNTNKRRLHYLLECLVKDETLPSKLSVLYTCILENLRDAEFCTITPFKKDQIYALLKTNESITVSDYEAVQGVLKKELKAFRNEQLEEQKHAVFVSLMSSNFASKKSFLDHSVKEFEINLTQVEAKMYGIITAYIGALLEALDIFVAFDERKEASVELLSTYAMKVHDPLMEHIFYEEERVHIEEGLKQIAVVYIGLYYQNLYM